MKLPRVLSLEGSSGLTVVKSSYQQSILYIYTPTVHDIADIFPASRCTRANTLEL